MTSLGVRTLNIAYPIIHVTLIFSQVLVLNHPPIKVYQEKMYKLYMLSRQLMENAGSYCLCSYEYVVV